MVAILITTIGVTLSVVGFLYLRMKQQHVIQAQVKAEAEQRIRAIEQRFRADVVSVYSLSSFVAETSPGTRADFEIVAHRALDRSPDVQAVMWVPRIRPDWRTAHEEDSRRQGLPDYEIHVRDRAGKSRPAPPHIERNDYFPVQFVSPAERQLLSPGLDLATVPVLHEALDQAVDAGRVIVTLPYLFDDATEMGRAFLAVRPMYHEIETSDTPDTMHDKLVGFFIVVIGVDALLNGTMDAYPPGINVQMFDMSSAKGWDFVCAYDADDHRTRFTPLETARASRGLGSIRSSALDVSGRQWALECSPSESFLVSRRSMLPTVTLIFGLALTGLVATYSNTVLGQKAKIEHLVIERTAELQETNVRLKQEVFDRNRAEDALRESERRFRSLVETTTDWIWEVDSRGFFTYASPRVKELLGYEAAEVLGRSRIDLIDVSERRTASDSFQEAVVRQCTILAVEHPYCHKDGHVVVMETNAAPIIAADGSLLGFRGISRDITARKQVERNLEYERFLLNTLLDQSPDFIYFKDTASRY
ncbi:MAG: CHASE domain-containing protein, partial [Planctomycetes bacterium]|nr:CHASE domain-containing protein [Planctomycetota bacterium]